MNAVPLRIVCGVMVLIAGAIGAGQERADPRVGLKPGIRDAGTAVRNLELVSSLPKPEGFFDPRQPAGEPTEPERPRRGNDKADPEPEPERPGAPPARSTLNFANSDLAFSRNHLFLGNFNGVNT